MGRAQAARSAFINNFDTGSNYLFSVGLARALLDNPRIDMGKELQISGANESGKVRSSVNFLRF
jgi:hypothetical protein